MEENRIVLKRTNKRDAAGFLLFVFLLPYVCACLWGHVGVEKDALRAGKYREQADETEEFRILADMKWGVWELSPEEYLVYKLESVMPENYEKEALKAQAVLLRTEIIRAWQEQGDDRLRVSGDGLEKWYETNNGSDTNLTPYTEAVEETKGLYLCYQGEPIQASYFKISNGRTRDAGKVWKTEKFPYLTSISCEQDKSAQEYRSEVTVSKTDYLQEISSHIGEEYSSQELWEGMRFIYDETGYVTNVSFYVEKEEVGQMDGEAFRYLFALPSASFETELTDTQIIFHVTGVGHGFGMSQYGANCKAINGESYNDILKEFFFGTELAKIE